MTPPTGTGPSANAAAAAAAAGTLTPGALPIMSVTNNFYNQITTLGIGITAASGVAGMISAASGSTTGTVVSALGLATGTMIALTGNQEQARRMQPLIDIQDILTQHRSTPASTSSSTTASSSTGQQDASGDETDLD